jgi:hypothetical protein
MYLRFFASVLIACCMIGLSLPAAVTAQQNEGQEQEQEQKKSVLYQWADEQGNVHITDNPGNIPEKYRAHAEKIEVLEGAEETVPPQQEAPGAGATPQKRMEQTDEFKKSVWQARVQEARTRLEDAEKRYQELEKERSELFGRWGGSPVYAPAEVKLRAQQLDESMKEVRKEIDEIRRELDEAIPEEARKAGVPPGWLRE